MSDRNPSLAATWPDTTRDDMHVARTNAEVAAMHARAALAAKYSVLHVHSYELLDDVLVIDIDCSERDRAYRCKWRASAEALEHDRLTLEAHWNHTGEELITPLDPSETLELERWMDASSAVREIHKREVEKALELFEP